MHDPAGQLSRRNAIRLSAGMCATAVAQCGWLQQLSFAATDVTARTKAVILLWLNGGPATIDLWDLKTGHPHGGAFREIATTVPGLRISQHLPGMASRAKDITLLRSLTSRDGDHQRATFFAHTGYVPQAGIDFPALGSLVAVEAPVAGLPNFVSILPSSRMNSPGNGFLPTHTAPVFVGEQAETLGDLAVKNLQPMSDEYGNFEPRQQLLNELNRRFGSLSRSALVDDLIATQQRAISMMDPSLSRLFDVTLENDAAQQKYGRTLFGQGCLLARRLVENGVRFVEVTLDGWDTHQDNFAKVAGLSQQLDTPFSALLDDLRDRNLLDSTLIICMGEFGRTPKINANQGRDHWPRAWSVLLAGSGLGRGAVVGATSDDGLEVIERPVTVPDLFATVAASLGIDPRKQHDSNVGRPIRVAAPDAQTIAELL